LVVFLRLAFLGVTNTLALLRLLPMSDRNKDAENPGATAPDQRRRGRRAAVPVRGGPDDSDHIGGVSAREVAETKEGYCRHGSSSDHSPRPHFLVPVKVDRAELLREGTARLRGRFFEPGGSLHANRIVQPSADAAADVHLAGIPAFRVAAEQTARIPSAKVRRQLR
jgi:hypothetical protein